MGQTKGSASQLAFVYVGTVVGAGFATGREIVEFFLKFGWIGLLGIVLSGLMFTYLGAKIMIISKRIHAKILSGIEHIFIRPVHRPRRKHVYDVYIAGSDLCHAVRSGSAVS